ncbi:MAG: hypothetical protein ACTSQP_09665 [Promethearchaeota archaeon]
MSQKAFIKNLTNKEKIAIDSNVFRNFDFINYLRKNKESIQTFIPTIVNLEIGYFHLVNGISWEDYVQEIKKFNGIFLEWDSIIISEVLNNAIKNKNVLPFKHHFRDFLIGSQCEQLELNLISYNINHFKWLKTISVLTPEEFLYFLYRIFFYKIINHYSQFS